MNDQNTTVIHVENISKEYRVYEKPIDRLKEALNLKGKRYSKDFCALSDISLEIHRGETFGIIGRNGAGKSTLLKLITGVLTPSKGSIAKTGLVSSLLELGTGFDFELSGYENIFLFGSLLGLSRDDMVSRVKDIEDFANIGSFISQPVKTYSSGMFARLAFSVAINVTPDILIVDEVLSVGDSAFQKKCIDKIHQMRDQGVTVLFVSHDEYMIRQLCQRALYLRDGKSIFIGDSEKCLQAYRDDLSNEVQAAAPRLNSNKSIDEFLFSICSVKLHDNHGKESLDYNIGDSITLKFKYRLVGKYSDKLTFVVNLYSSEGVYVWGTTTKMDNLDAVKAQDEGEVGLRFNNIKLLSGRYTLRVAVNDESGIGIFCEANPAVKFSVSDNFESVGLINLEREWTL